MELPPAVQKGIDDTKVEYVKLGSSGLRVSYPILGGMGFGDKQWQPWVLDEEESLKVLKAAYDKGITTWDTADMYSNGYAEQIMGNAITKLKLPREKLVLMTKCSQYVGEEPNMFTPFFGAQLSTSKDYVNRGGLSRSAIFKAVDASLARLQTSYIDLYQVHRFDPETPVEETMKALHDLVQAGKVRYLGASSMWATQFARMQFVAERNGWTRFVSMQNLYNLLYREEEREMLRFCQETGVGVIPYSPMFGGKLAHALGTGDTVRQKTPSPVGSSLSEADQEIIRRVEKVAKDKGWNMGHVALSWHRSKGAVPIVGFNSTARIDEACELRGKTLTAEEVKYLEEPYVPKNVMGHF